MQIVKGNEHPEERVPAYSPGRKERVMERTYERGFAAGLRRAWEIATWEFYVSPQNAMDNTRSFLELETLDADAHADTGGCIADVLNEGCPRCAETPSPWTDYQRKIIDGATPQVE